MCWCPVRAQNKTGRRTKSRYPNMNCKFFHLGFKTAKCQNVPGIEFTTFSCGLGQCVRHRYLVATCCNQLQPSIAFGIHDLVLRRRNRHPKKKMGPKTGRKTRLPQFADLQLCTKVVTFIPVVRHKAVAEVSKIGNL